MSCFEYKCGVGEVNHHPFFLSKLSISEFSGSIGIWIKKKSTFYFLSAKGAEGGGQGLADMSTRKSGFFYALL